MEKAWNGPFQGNEENFDMFQKWEKVLYVYNISLCDENESRKISENKLHQNSKSPYKWK